MKHKLLRLLKEYAVILFGSIIYAAAFDWLFVPNNIVMGGFTGIAQIINHFIPILPIGIIVMVLNIPLFAVGMRLRGVKLLFSSGFAMITSSIAIDVIPGFVNFEPMNDQLLVCILGGAMIGVGFGLQLWVGATTGGTELAATLLKHKFKHMSIGKLCLIIDFIVIGIYAFVFKSLEDAMYAVIAMYVITTAIDSVIYGRKTSKVACIVSSKGDELSETLIEMDLGITEIKGKGGFSNEERQVLICAFKPSRIAFLKKAVVEVDPDAFVIVCDSQEVYGEGFADCRTNSL